MYTIDPDRLLPHAQRVYARYIPPCEQQARIAANWNIVPPIHSENSGSLQILLEMNPEGAEALKAQLGQNRFTPLHQIMQRWLEPKTRKYASALITDSTLRHTHPDMLVKVDDMNCLDITLTLTAENGKGKQLPQEEGRQLAEAVMTKLRHELLKYQWREQDTRDAIERADDRMNHIVQQSNYETRCISYLMQRDLKHSLDENIKNLFSRNLAQQQR